MNENRDAAGLEATEYVTICFESPAFSGEDVHLRRLSGREAMSQPFDYELYLLARDYGAIDPQALLDNTARLVFQRGEETDGVHTVCGMIASVDDCFECEWGFTGYRVRFVPRVWRLSLHETLDIFMDQNVPDIISKVLKAAGFQEKLDFEFRLLRKYPVRDFVVQYKETDLNFISRLTEHLGITYFFEHRDGRDVIVFSDDNIGFRAIGEESAVPYNRGETAQGVFTLEARTQAVPSKVVVRDYNYRNPSLDVMAEGLIPAGRDGTIVEYGAHCKDPEEAAALAKVRAEEILAGRRVYRGESHEHRFAPGAFFTLEEGPGGDIPLLVTELRNTAVQSVFQHTDGAEIPYTNEFRAISKTTAYRPPRVTPKPRVHGTLTGIVEPSDNQQYADIDDRGRYRVKFLFDTAAPGERKASKPVRMAQPHAGPGYGMHFPLRPYTEVILTCIDGDPDRPIIAGAVPNPQTDSPVVADNSRKNIIRSGGANEIEIDDNEGSERIKLSTPNMSTVFQLGAPNAPESGAMLATVGASTTCATAGVGGFSTLFTSVCAFSDLKKAKDIIAVAEDPGPIDKVAVVALAATSLVAATTAVLAVTRAGMNTRLAAEKLEATKSQAAVDQQNDALIPLKTDLVAKGDTLKNSASTPPTAEEQAVLAALAEYEAACTKLDDDRTALETARDEKADAHRKKMVNAEAAADTKIAELTAAIAADEAARDTTRAALEAAIDALPADSAMKSAGTDYLAQADEVATAKDDAAESNVTAKSDARDAADVEYEYSTGETGVGMTAAETSLGIASAGMAAISLIYNIYNRVKKTSQDLTQESQWAQSANDLLGISPRSCTPPANPFGVGAFPFAGTTGTTRMNYQGSSGNAALFGHKKVYVWGETAVLCGRNMAPAAVVANAASGTPPATPPAPPTPTGTAVVMGEKLALLLSNDTTEVKGTTKVYISGKEIDAESEELMKLTSVTKNIEILAKELVKLTSSDKNIECAAANGEIKGDAKTIAMTAAESLTLTCGQSSLTLKEDGTIDLKGVKVTVAGSGEVALTSDATVTVAGKGGTDILSDATVNVQGLKVQVIGDTEVTAQGGMMTIEGSSMCEVKSGGVAVLKGSLVQIN